MEKSHPSAMLFWLAPPVRLAPEGPICHIFVEKLLEQHARTTKSTKYDLVLHPKYPVCLGK